MKLKNLGKRPTLFALLLILALAWLSPSCNVLFPDDDDDDDEPYPPEDEWITDENSTDTYQEEFRGVYNRDISYRLNPDVKIFSAAQLHSVVDLIGDSIIIFSRDVDPSLLPAPGELYVYSSRTSKCENPLMGGMMCEVVDVIAPDVPLSRLGASDYDSQWKVIVSIASLAKVFTDLRISMAAATLDPKWLYPSTDLSYEFATDGAIPIFDGKWEAIKYRDSRFRASVTPSIGLEMQLWLTLDSSTGTLLVDMLPYWRVGASYSLTFDLAKNGSIGYKETHRSLIGGSRLVPFTVAAGPIAIPCRIDFNFNWYWLLEAELSLSAGYSRQWIGPKVTYGWKNWLFHAESAEVGDPRASGTDNFEAEMLIKGAFVVGVRFPFSIWICNIPVGGRQCAAIDASLKVSGELGLSSHNAAISDLRDTSVDFALETKALFNPTLDITKWWDIEGVREDKDQDDDSKTKWDFLTFKSSIGPFRLLETRRYLIPAWRSTNASFSGSGVSLGAELSRDMLLPVYPGYFIYDADDMRYVGQGISPKPYFDSSKWDPHDLFATVGGLEKGKTYIARPAVSLLGATAPIPDWGDYRFTLGETPDTPVDPPDAPDTPEAKQLVAIGDLVAIGYDDEGRANHIIVRAPYDDETEEWRIEYNNQGLPAKISALDGDEWVTFKSFTFSDQGYITSMKEYDDDGQFGSFTLKYDEWGHLTSLTGSSEGEPVSYTLGWDSDGRLLSWRQKTDDGSSYCNYTYQEPRSNPKGCFTYSIHRIHAGFFYAGLWGVAPSYLPSGYTIGDADGPIRYFCSWEMGADGYIASETFGLSDYPSYAFTLEYAWRPAPSRSPSIEASAPRSLQAIFRRRPL